MEYAGQQGPTPQQRRPTSTDHVHPHVLCCAKVRSLKEIRRPPSNKGEGILRYLLGAGVPILAGSLWSVLHVPGDPGPAPVAVPGWLRLLLELALFAFAVWALYASAARALAGILVAVVVLHFVLSYDRLAVLMRK